MERKIWRLRWKKLTHQSTERNDGYGAGVVSFLDVKNAAMGLFATNADQFLPLWSTKGTKRRSLGAAAPVLQATMSHLQGNIPRFVLEHNLVVLHDIVKTVNLTTQLAA